ncbi:hypothetical protein P7C70_g4338, partial [Phenoliferia sp. Uapishka_3]
MGQPHDSRIQKERQLLKLFGSGVAISLALYLVASLSGHANLPSRPSFPTYFLPQFDPTSDPSFSHQSSVVQDQGWSSPLKSRLAKRLELLKRASSSPTSIPISSALPSTSGLSPHLVQAWDDAFNSLSSAATDLTASLLRRRKRQGLENGFDGIPGTRATTEEAARELQANLDCMSGKGEWVYEPEGGSRESSASAGLTVHKHSGVLASCDKRYYKGHHLESDFGDAKWDVRESLKWRWVPSSTCAGAASRPSAPLSRVGLCTLLAHKSTLLVGDTLQYSLHDLLLDWTSTEPLTCYGDMYCKEHSLCGSVLRAKNGIENWDADEHVFQRLPPPPSLHKRALSESEPESGIDSTTTDSPSLERRQAKGKSVSYGTMLRYRRSDGAQSNTRHLSPTFTHPFTGVREVNMQWYADARRSDIVILTKPPLPLPLRGHNETWDSWWDSSEEDPEERIVEAARIVTEQVWLPELMETLRAIRWGRDGEPALLVYRGGWRSHSDCSSSGGLETSFKDWDSPGDGPPPHSASPTLQQILSSSSPIHTQFHNVQTIFQNHLVRTTLAPTFGMAFLDLESTLSVWRSGMLGGSASNPFQPGFTDQSGGGGLGKGLRSQASGDCLRYCLPSPGMAIEEAFLGGLMRVLGNQ